MPNLDLGVRHLPNLSADRGIEHDGGPRHNGLMESSYLRLTARAASQHGVFTTSQAAELDVASSVLSRRVRNGSLARPYEGVYVVAGTPATWERSVIVAVYSSSAQAVASHATACHLYELARRPRRIEVSVPGDSRPVRNHIIHRSTDLVPTDVQLVKGIPCTSPARTLVDSGIPWGEKFAGRCLDEGVRRGIVSDAEVAAVLHRVGRKGRNGVGPIRLVLVTRLGWAGLTESQIEAELFRLLKEAGIDLPEAQVRIHRRGGAIIARVDFIFHEVMLVIELDGFNFHADPQSFRRDRRSQNALVLEGYRVLRFSAWDVMAAPEYVVSQVMAALTIDPAAATSPKFGK